MHRRIEVVAGVIVGDVPQQFLITRKMKEPWKGRWEFPGGKINEGESHEEALRRELKEELGVEVEIGPHILSTEHVYYETGLVVTLHAYFAQINGKADDASPERRKEQHDDIAQPSNIENAEPSNKSHQEILIENLKLVDHDKARWITLNDVRIQSVQYRRDSGEDPSTILHSQIDPEFERKHSYNKTHHISTIEDDQYVSPISLSTSNDENRPLTHKDFMAADIPILNRLAELSFFLDMSPRLRL